MSLKITLRKESNVHVFELDGSLDSITADQLETDVVAALDAGAMNLLFDMVGVKHVASAGLRVFILAYRRLQDKGLVVFAGLQPVIRQVFNMTGLSFRVEIFNTVQEALQQIGKK